jgi:hypothetical protein
MFAYIDHLVNNLGAVVLFSAHHFTQEQTFHYCTLKYLSSQAPANVFLSGKLGCHSIHFSKL